MGFSIELNSPYEVFAVNIGSKRGALIRKEGVWFGVNTLEGVFEGA